MQLARRSLALNALPVAAVGAAVLMTRLTGPSNDIPYTLFLAAVFLSAWFGGLKRAMIALALSILAAYALFLPADPDREAGAGLFLRSARFALVSGLFIWLIESRRRADGAVRESEERYRGTFENAAVGVAQVAIDGRWTSVNQKLCDLLGYAREELLERTWMDLTHPEDRADVRELADRLLRGERPSESIDQRYIRKDGTTLWATVTTSIQWDADGRPDDFIAIIQDVSECKRLEHELIQASARLDLAIRVSNVGIWEVDMPDGVYANGTGTWINVWEQLGLEPPEQGSPFVNWLELLALR